MNYAHITKEVEQKLAIAGLPEDIKEAVVLGLTENILKRTLILIAKIITDDEATTFTEQLEAGNVEEVLANITKKHPEFNALVSQTVEEVLDEFTSKMI